MTKKGLTVDDAEHLITLGNNLAEHIITMADDAYLTGHPEWDVIVTEAYNLVRKQTRRIAR